MTDDLSVAGVKIPPAVRTAGVAAASGAAVVVAIIVCETTFGFGATWAVTAAGAFGDAGFFPAKRNHPPPASAVTTTAAAAIASGARPGFAVAAAANIGGSGVCDGIAGSAAAGATGR